ncbi:hypothetical protein OPV22_024375 [Ensete ventricosum]|uniref:Conserved Oligomeric Golgi complex subunit 6 C-terminal domain-containing protein n=1 Tax=Ensete ventricosum TaxID=4639 RepID=A0AAV8Q4W4_ENSVE|nr:hypothetical protein OPV22_024375 [Ensete ventricosum]
MSRRCSVYLDQRRLLPAHVSKTKPHPPSAISVYMGCPLHGLPPRLQIARDSWRRRWLNHKGYRTGNLRNIDNVWKAGQKHDAQQLLDERDTSHFRLVQWGSYCAEEIANMRHHALFRRFISALTRGGPGGLPRPFEVHAHDPLRYVGDMLGWLHQILPAASITGPFPMGSFSEITNPSCEQAKIDVPMDNPLHSSIITSDCNEGVRIDHREVGEESKETAATSKLFSGQRSWTSRGYKHTLIRF